MKRTRLTKDHLSASRVRGPHDLVAIDDRLGGEDTLVVEPLPLLGTLLLLLDVPDADEPTGLEGRTEFAGVAQLEDIMVRAQRLAGQGELGQLGVAAKQPGEEGNDEQVVAALVDVDDERRRGDLVLREHFLDLSVPRVAHLAKQDDRVDGVGLGLDELKVLGRVVSRWVKVEDRLGLERNLGIEWRQGVGSGGRDELKSVSNDIYNDPENEGDSR